MNWPTVFIAGAICVAMATAEGVLTTRSFAAWLNSLKHPRLYAPMSVWVAVALMTYVLQGVIVYRLIEWSDPVLGRASLLMLAVV
ncbi:MAG: tryptophan-rich sensory protein [Hyphomonadaceae bacterium]|nr:tryptophan-rich sensory protein [Hyphomonadaceae bacterium]